MKVRIFIVLVSFVCMIPFQMLQASADKWSYLDKVADQALQMTKKEEYKKAQTLLEHFSYEFKTQENDTTVSMTQLRVLTVSYEEAIKAVNSNAMDPKQRLQKVMQFRFAVDAIHSNYQPLWTEMEQSVMSSFQEMKESLLEDETQLFSYQLNQFLNKYDVIYPSLVIDLDPEQLNKLDSHISFLEQYQTASDTEQVTHLKKMENDLIHLFDTLHMEETDPSFISVATSIASIIFFTLFYVGWKKYRGDHKSVKV